MTSLGGRALLDLWEQACTLDSAGRLRVLAAAGDADLAEAHSVSLGRANAALLALHDAVTGPSMDAIASCPGCGETVEFTVTTPELLAVASTSPGSAALDVEGWYVAWRALTVGDVEIVAAGAPDDAESTLLALCVESVKDPDGAPREPAELPAQVRAALARAMTDADPLADIVATLVCPGCDASFGATVDVSSFVWAEVDAGARRLLLDVDCLARAYGWTEDAVLALTDARRATYLRIVTDGTP